MRGGQYQTLPVRTDIRQGCRIAPLFDYIVCGVLGVIFSAGHSDQEARSAKIAEANAPIFSIFKRIRAIPRAF